MRNDELPVTVSVTREDGSVEHVQIGTAVRRGEGFSIRLFELTVGAGGEPVRAGGGPRRPSASPGEPPTVFPPYGRSKGLPIRGANAQDLEFYATGARRTLADPGKARFHDKERALLVVIEAEQARQGGGGDEPPTPEDDAAF